MFELYKKINYLANWISILRIFSIFPFIYFLIFRKSSFLTLNPFHFKIIALSLFILIVISDFLDGYLARLLNQENFLGSILDYLADKIVVLSTYISIYYFYPGTIPIWLLWSIILREVFILLLRFSDLKERKVFFIGKIKTFLHFITIFGILLLLTFQEFQIVYQNLEFLSFSEFLNFYFRSFPYLKISFDALLSLNAFVTILSGLIYFYFYTKASYES